MAGKTIDITHFLTPDRLGTVIAQYWQEWNNKRQPAVSAWTEVRQYVYATDTTTTTNSTLPWKNKTTLPKLCQIRDNLYANYMATMFPKSKWFDWEGTDTVSESTDKKEAIESYIMNAVSQPRFLEEMGKAVLDFIDYGNTIGTVDWVDETVELDDRTQVGYVGPVFRRISPLDIVFNPVAENFENTPKIVRSIVSLGEVKKMLNAYSSEDTQEEIEELWNYLRNYRYHVSEFTGNITAKDTFYQVDGFDTFQGYLQSNYAEILTFYGDIYDIESDTFYENYIIQVIDRHKIICKKPNPSYFGLPPIYHVGWRKRQDNLWAMGPLDNLVGMQYRIDHLENLKADVFDLVAFPVLKIKGYVEDFEWGPLERIQMADDGDVEIVAPPYQALQTNIEIQGLMDQMEAMAGAPKEAMGIRSPGEKTKYEVQRLENAAARIFQSKISQFERQFVEKVLNAMLELARRMMNGKTTIRSFDSTFNIAVFRDLTITDVTGSGSLKPKASRHFAEKAEKIQNLSNFFQSPVYMDQMVNVHFSSLAIAKMTEDLLELQEYELVTPYVRVSERAEQMQMEASAQEQVMDTAMTPAGISPDDTDEPFLSEGGI